MKSGTPDAGEQYVILEFTGSQTLQTFRYEYVLTLV